MPFEKGQSGNPGGRPKENKEVRELARKHTRAAIARLLKWMRSDNPKASVTAAIAILDRGHGRPIQMNQFLDENDQPMSFDQIDKLELARGLAFFLRVGQQEAERTIQ